MKNNDCEEMNFFATGCVNWFSLDLKSKFYEGQYVDLRDRIHDRLDNSLIKQVNENGIVVIENKRKTYVINYTDIIEIHLAPYGNYNNQLAYV